MMKHSRILKEHVVFNNTTDIKRLTQPLLPYGINYFSHISVDQNNVASFICNDPGYSQALLQTDYLQHSLIQQKPEYEEHYILSDHINRKGKTLSIYNLMKDYGWGHMFTIVRQQQGQRDYYHFATSLGNESMNSQYLWYLADLSEYIEQYQQHVQQHRLLDCDDDLKIYLNPPCQDFMRDAFTFFQSQQSLDASERRRTQYKGVVITERECQCLYWMAQDKGYREISDLLGISLRTVKAHIDNIKRKTGLCCQFQLGMMYHELNQSDECDT